MKMKKKFSFVLMSVLAAVVMTGCLKDNGNPEQERLLLVMPGINIYNATINQNIMALQPAGIAIRFAILRTEAEERGKLDQLDQVFIPDKGNVKRLLLGANTNIKEKNGVYEIEYTGGGGMPSYDNYPRMGTVSINTGGRALEDTDAEHPWIVQLVSEKFLITPDSPNATTLTSTGNTTICRVDDNYRISFNDAAAYVNEKFISSWTGSFTLKAGKGEKLNFAELEDVTFGLTGAASGESFWTFNGSTRLNLKYEVEEGKYAPSKIGAIRIMGGVERCYLTNPADYNAEIYPAPEVKVTWSFKESKLSYVVDYDKYSLEFGLGY